MTAATEKHAFQAEVADLLHLVVHSLYEHRDIFLRELVSNASDALDRLRIAALRDPDLAPPGHRPRIRIDADPEARTLSVSDTGIGMSREEVAENLGTIARSGTKRFLEELRAGEAVPGELPKLIGQFGVGFYASFMVAFEVEVVTRRAGEEGATRWTSRGDGEFALEDAERDEPGTTVTLRLRPPEEDEPDYAREWTVREIVRRYSDFVEHPIEMEVERTEGEGEERKTARRVETLNSRKPLWTRRKAEIEASEYAEFYKHFTHDWNDPLETIHLRAEGTLEYTALLFVPAVRPFDLFDPKQRRSQVHLYVKRVHVEADCEELVPVWLRFVRGLVDATDLPLNVSRETLQSDRQLAQIRKRVTRKVIDALAGMLANDRERYERFWHAFGPVLKEGIYYDDEHRDELARLALFYGTHGEGLTTLAEYVERMPEGQEAIYWIAGSDHGVLASSPHLEALRVRGYEALFLLDAVDEFVTQRLREHDGKELVPIDRGDLELGGEEEASEREARAKELEPLCGAIREALSEHVADVRVSSRLVDSPAVLVADASGVPPNLERILRDARQSVGASRRILELNPSHPLVQKLDGLRESDAARFGEWCELVLGQALVREGAPVPDPQRFSKLVTSLMA